MGIASLPVAGQAKSKSNQKANEGDRAMVSRSVSRTDDEAPHARKGKKGFATPAKRSSQQAPASKARTSPTSTQTAKKNSVRERTTAKVEPAAVAKVEPPRDEEPVPPPVLAVADRIEVVEWSAKPSSSTQSRPAPAPTKPGVSNRRYEVDIDPGRVQQIQQALISRGFLSGEATSIYDEATIEAMRLFQQSQKIDATGYPTAQALKRLGL